MDRWRMHKLGFLNFWLYDQEEFLLENGHILLRGNNGAGKSITTQSFIPFILDGNRRPERLDPFGSTAKKMDFYLLGDNEDTKEETGYLYLEFKKEGLEEYLTIGIGMRAKRGSGIDQWGFCLNDGRRIGPDGVRLYEKRGRQLIPLSRQQLKSLLDDDENWADNAEMYKALVNRRVFRFRDIRQYEQLLQMLLKVRKPKLSKDDFRPTALKEILNDSLRVLTDEDLSAMVSTMERMDSLEGTIRGCREAMQDARTIRNEYTRYNQYVLGRKGRAYLETRSAVQRLTNQLEDQRARCGELEKELAAQEQRKHTSAEAYQQAKAQRAAMGDDELSAKQSQLSQLLASCERLQSGRRTRRTASGWRCGSCRTETGSWNWGRSTRRIPGSSRWGTARRTRGRSAPRCGCGGSRSTRSCGAWTAPARPGSSMMTPAGRWTRAIWLSGQRPARSRTRNCRKTASATACGRHLRRGRSATSG